MAKARFRIQEHKDIYIHNDLANAAFYFKERISGRLKNDDREGIGIEMMACLTMIAFAVEARMNFLGYKLIEKWKERAPFMVKVEKVTRRLGVAPDYGERPYKTIESLKNFRDTLAHGKPLEIRRDLEVEATEEELRGRGCLSAPWETSVSGEFVEVGFEDMEAVWRDLLARSRLGVMETITQGGATISFIGPVG
ncbi:hypothetical protein LCM4577_01970 [Mesorhizobium sp. LCM 4577]|uniref:hypothetical protein n=1 Tax=Mesorhizobium sp. LCM 4577 TaxID=1848288 RepID=UPI0008D9A21C|nr:hypothetical protein [Mesorhizobium sp. LCM 4577]OHV70958.1 hypothetical protein LCM4577_01970 [Mesorhizobium sp. LCM 4577]